MIVVLSALYLTRSVTRPLARIAASGRRLAEGDVEGGQRGYAGARRWSAATRSARLRVRSTTRATYIREMSGAADRIAANDLSVEVEGRESPK